MSGLVIRCLIVIGVFALWAYIAACTLTVASHHRRPVDLTVDPAPPADAGSHGHFGRPGPHGP